MRHRQFRNTGAVLRSERQIGIPCLAFEARERRSLFSAGKQSLSLMLPAVFEYNLGLA